MNLALQNKLALVTGSSRGIGAAIAKHLAQNGAAVLVHYSVSRGRAEGVANATGLSQADVSIQLDAWWTVAA